MKIENTYKDWFASLLGSVAMVYAGYSWHLDDLTDAQAGSVAFIGFVLLFLRTTLTRVIGEGLSKVFDAVMGKIFGKGGPPAAIFLFMLVSFTASGQYYNMQEARIVDKNDSTLISGVAQIRWDGTKIRFGNGTTWSSFRKESDPLVSTIGTINGGTEHANGASISGSTLYMQTADATYPGLVSTGTQTFAGAKTFNSDILIGNTNGNISFNEATTFIGRVSTAGFHFDDANAGDLAVRSTTGQQVLLGPPGASMLRVNSTGVGIGGAPTAGYILNLQNNSGNTYQRIGTTGSGDLGINFIRAAGSATTWSLYSPAGSTDLRLLNSLDRFTFSSAGVGTATDWVATSDRRLKKDIKYVDSQLEKVNAISRHVVNYNRIDNGRNETGFVAQELYEIAPEYVNKPENDSTMWSVNYSKMVVPLYKAIEELTAEVNKLKQELNELKK